MADLDSSQGTRRSQREKKQVKHFVSVDSAVNKRKRTDSDTEDNGAEPSDIDEPLPEHDDDEVEEEYRASKSKPNAATSGRKTKMKSRGAPLPKKARTAKATSSKAPKATTRKSKKTKPDENAFDAEKVAKDTKISGDNPLFNAVMNPSAALQSTAEDFLESLAQTPGPAQAELINLVLRACGCNDSVDADEAVDYDGVVDALDNFTEGLKNDDSPVYPLTSKLPAFKKFRKSLSEFLERLISSSAELGSLYTSDLMATLQTWVVAMSSSQIRSFRHTATVVALEVETALCDVAAAVEKEAEVIGRQREGERKRKATNKGAGVREKELDGKAAEVRDRRTKLAEFLKEFVDGVFVHRYRDLDPNIRAECVRAIGLWFTKYPGHFLDGAYLRYVGWVLSDANTQVRLEAVNALSGVYAQADYIGSLNHFTERFKPRLIEMAKGDTELGVRAVVIKVLGAIDGHSLLEDEEREKLCLLVFDGEARVRKAVSGFVRGVWDDSVDERLVGKKVSEKDKERAGVKALGLLLVKWGKALDKADADDASSAGDDESLGEGSSRRGNKGKDVPSFIGGRQKGRIALAVEALWDEVDPASNWETLLDILLLDHSAAGENGVDGNLARRSKGKQTTGDSVVDEAWRLEEVEESVLLEVLVAALRRAKAEVTGSKKGEVETVTSDITRALIKGLPRLFIKYQTDQNRIANVLLIPPLMSLDLYLEMRMLTAYANLWDDVTKQFLSHSSTTVLTHAVTAVQHFMNATSLSNTNSTKILELEDELSTALRDAVAGREEIEVTSFLDDEVLSLTALCARLHLLAGTRDMTGWTEEDEGGKQSSAWDIISALIDRGKLGYKEEETMIDEALHFLTLHIMWKARRLTTDPEGTSEGAQFRETLREQRESLLEKLIEYAVGTQSNTAEGVKRAAFQNLMNLHILFCPAQTVAPDGSPLPIASLALSLDDEVQYRCAGFIQAEIERYSEETQEEVLRTEGGSDQEESSGSESDEDDEDDDNAPKRKRKAGTGKAPTNGALADRATSRSRLAQEYSFLGVISTFLRAVCASAIQVHHSAVLVAHYGRLGAAFDSCSKAVVDVLREEGMYNNNGDVVATVITQALRESFTMVLDGVVDTDAHSVALAKLLASCFLIRGAQLSVVRRLDSKFVVQVNTGLLTWIGKRLATYENNKNKNARKTAILFFRVLLPLLTTLESRDALTLKAHMDQVLAQAKVDVSATSKIWEAQRAYEKRLNTIMSKDKAPGAKGRKNKGAKSGVLVTSDEDTAGESGGEGIDEGEPIVTPSRPRPRPRPANRSAATADTGPLLESLSEPEGGEHDDVAELATDAVDLDTPKVRPRPRATYKTRSPTKSPTKSPSKPAVVPETTLNGKTTPIASRKRPLSDEAAEGDEQALSAHDSEAGDSRLSSPPPSPATPPSDFQIRRKRARH